MKSRLALPLLALMTFAVVSCETTLDTDPGSRPAPRVALPYGLSDKEARFVPDLEDALIRAGYRPVRGSNAEYTLSFEVDDGPVNADVHLSLTQDGSDIVRAYARTGGPGILLRRDEYIRESFNKCLRDFERRLPSAGSSWSRGPAAYDRPPVGGYRTGEYENMGGYERPY